MPSITIIFTLLMLPAVCLLAASMVVSLLESKDEHSSKNSSPLAH